eukprot:gene662-8163_t
MFVESELELTEALNSITRDLVTLDALPEIPSLRQNYIDIITGNIKKATSLVEELDGQLKESEEENRSEYESKLNSHKSNLESLSFQFDKILNPESKEIIFNFSDDSFLDMPMPTSKETSTFGYHYDDHDLEMNSMPPAPNKPLLDEEEEETIEKPIQFENPDSINYHETLEEDEYDDENEERICFKESLCNINYHCFDYNVNCNFNFNH